MTEPNELLERWPGYNEQSWWQRFEEIDRQNEQYHAKMQGLIKQIAGLLVEKNARMEADATTIRTLLVERDAAYAALRALLDEVGRSDCADQVLDSAAAGKAFAILAKP